MKHSDPIFVSYFLWCNVSRDWNNFWNFDFRFDWVNGRLFGIDFRFYDGVNWRVFGNDFRFYDGVNVRVFVNDFRFYGGVNWRLGDKVLEFNNFWLHNFWNLDFRFLDVNNWINNGRHFGNITELIYSFVDFVDRFINLIIY